MRPTTTYSDEITGRWDYHYDSSVQRPLLRHGYWPVLLSWARRDFHSRYRQSGLRTIWAIWQPTSLVAINGIFFYAVLSVNGGGLPYLAFIVASLAAFRFLSAGLGAVTIISDNADVISKSYFPREIIPLSTLLVSLVDLAAMLVILLGVSVVQGVHLTITLVALPIPLLLLGLFTVAATLFLATLCVFIRDVSFVTPTLTQLLFLGSPLMYPSSQTPKPIRWLNHFNPLAVIVEAIRDVVLRGRWPFWRDVLPHMAVMALLAVAALYYLRSLEGRMADVA